MPLAVAMLTQLSVMSCHVMLCQAMISTQGGPACREWEQTTSLIGALLLHGCMLQKHLTAYTALTQGILQQTLHAAELH